MIYAQAGSFQIQFDFMMKFEVFLIAVLLVDDITSQLCRSSSDCQKAPNDTCGRIGTDHVSFLKVIPKFKEFALK